MIPWQIPLPLLFFDGKSGQGKHLLTPPIIHSHCPKEDYRFFHLGVCLNLGFSESKPWRMQWCQAEEEETLVICALVSALPWKAAGHQPHRACSEKARRGAPESTHQRLWSLGGLSISFRSREWVCPLRANHAALPTVLCPDPSVAGKVLRRGKSWPAWHWEAVHMLARSTGAGELRRAQRMLMEKSLCCSACPLPPRTMLRQLGESFRASAYSSTLLCACFYCAFCII